MTYCRVCIDQCNQRWHVSAAWWEAEHVLKHTSSYTASSKALNGFSNIKFFLAFQKSLGFFPWWINVLCLLKLTPFYSRARPHCIWLTTKSGCWAVQKSIGISLYNTGDYYIHYTPVSPHNSPLLKTTIAQLTGFFLYNSDYQFLNKQKSNNFLTKIFISWVS